MNHLYSRTRGNSDPHGKPRVFFACHPEEFARYFDSTVDLLHKYNNCAVWYEAEGELLSEEELRSQLSEMQLVVIPVTTKLLIRRNRAMEVVYPFALERHIPVLPLMMETKLDELFNQKFGDLQYLQPENNDPTAIPFEEKLEKYLSGVLVGDELAAKVRAAFDAYIFLSYRKKDRKYAQELMRMIHRSPKYRDIAIWYDEYLVPGENFNESIRAALSKSDLFALVVTPSLLEKPNYVMNEEYPRAREVEKPILPVEMQPTDPERLAEHYEGLSDCVPGQENEAWEQTLLDALHRVALAENDGDPQHNFLIGLAYLDGIDVEVNSERAVQLITGAADSGLEEAIRQLVTLYETGKGVERNYHTGAAWREKLAVLLRERYRESGSEEDYDSLFSALWNLGDAILDLGQPEQARIPYEEMKELAEPLPFWSSRRDLSVSYNKLGDIAWEQGQLAQAQRYHEQALAISEQLEEEKRTIETRRDLSIGYRKLGDIAKTQGRLAQAQRYYEQSFAIREQLAVETGTVQSRRDLSVSYNKLGDIAQAQEQLGKARRYYEQSLAIREQLAKEMEPVQARRVLLTSYERLGNNARAMFRGLPERAQPYYEQCLAIREQLVKETGTVGDRRGLSVSYNDMGDIAREEGRLAEAQQYYEQSFAIIKQLAEETETLYVRWDLSVSYERLGDIAKAQGRLEDAQQYYEQTLVIHEQLAEETGTVGDRRGLSVSYGKLGDIAREQGHLAEAQRYYEQSFAIREQLVQEMENAQACRDLRSSFERLGDIAREQGQPEEAQQYYAISKRLEKETNTMWARWLLSFSYREWGDTAQEQGRLQEAQQYYEQSLAIRERLAKETGTWGKRRDLAVSYNLLGGIAEEQGQLAEAQRYYEQGLAINEQLAQETSAVWMRRYLSASYGKLGDIAREQGHLAEAQRYYEQGLAICEQLAEKAGTLEVRRDLAFSYGDLGSMPLFFNMLLLILVKTALYKLNYLRRENGCCTMIGLMFPRDCITVPVFLHRVP